MKMEKISSALIQKILTMGESLFCAGLFVGNGGNEYYDKFPSYD